MCQPKEVSFPKDIDPNKLANNFGNFFVQIGEDINNKIRETEVGRPAMPFIDIGDTHVHTDLCLVQYFM